MLIIKKIVFGILLLNLFLCIAATFIHIFPNEIEASSYLNNDNYIFNNYHPYYVLDDNPDTAWVEGVKGDGLNEYLRFFIDIPINIKFSLNIRNGYQKNKDLFYENNRVKEMELRLVYYDGNCEKYDSYNIQLKDKFGWQKFNYRTNKTYVYLELVIKSIYSGTKYHDTCLSDVLLNTNSKLDVIQQKVNKSKYSKWFQKMNLMETYFKKLPPDYPFKNYQKFCYKVDLPINDKKYDISNLDNIFSNVDWNRYYSSESGNYVKQLLNEFNKFTIDERRCKINFKKTILYKPFVLSENIFDNINNFLMLKNMYINFDETKGIKWNSKTYYLTLFKNKIVRIAEILVNEDSDTEVNYYYYNANGNLIYIDGEKNRDDGDFCNSAFLVWTNNKISKIFVVSAEESDKIYFSLYVFK